MGLGGCAGRPLYTGSTPVALPDGTQGYAIHCNGIRNDVSSCMNEAAAVCGGAYHIVSTDQTDTGGAVMPAGNSAVFVRGIRRSMIVSCGAK